MCSAPFLVYIGLEINSEELAPQQTKSNVEPPRLINLSKDELTTLITMTAIQYGIDKVRFLATAKCESSLRPEVIGDDGASVGLWQIHLPSHPEVTMEQAKDPYFATEWSAKKFKKNPRIWTCYRILYGTHY